MKRILHVTALFAFIAAVTGTAVIADATTVRLETSLGPIEIELYEDEAPRTTANFLSYVADGSFDGSFFHRLDPRFVLQGGGYTFDPSKGDFAAGGGVAEIPQGPPIPNEAGLSNEKGTVAMALLAGDPNSARSQWFINLEDNSGDLDPPNGSFAVFGRVTDATMATVEAIGKLRTRGFTSVNEFFSQVPVRDYSFGSAVTTDNLVMIHAAYVVGTLPVLPAATLSGKVSGAEFRGGATADGGMTYGQVFQKSDTVRVEISVSVQADHRGRNGRMITAALVAGVLFVRDADGLWDVWDRTIDGLFEDAAPRPLADVEGGEILTIPLSGLGGLTLGFLKGYEAPDGDIHFTAEPVVVTIAE